MQEFGGLEEYAVSLAIWLQEAGHQVSILSTAWVAPDNQYLRRLRTHGVEVTQVPKWLSLAASDWPTKERILRWLMGLLRPLRYGLALGLWLRRRSSWTDAHTSAYHWLCVKLMHQMIGPDRRQPLARMLLRWWQLRRQPDLLHLHGYTTNLLFVIDWAAAGGTSSCL